MKLQPTTLSKEYEEIKKGKLIEKDEAEILLENWIKDQIEHAMRYRPKSDERMVDDVFDIIVDHWISQPLLLAACREVDFNKTWISDRLLRLKAEIEEELREEAIDIIEDKTIYGLPQTRPIMPTGPFGTMEGEPMEDDGRAMAYSLTTIDEEFNKGRGPDRQPRKRKGNMSDEEKFNAWVDKQHRLGAKSRKIIGSGDIYGKSMEKSQVKSHIRTRKGKMERVKEYSRIGEKTAQPSTKGNVYNEWRVKPMPNSRVGEEQAPYKPEKEKNPASKMRKVDRPYEIWRSGDWEWRVLKKYQSPSKEKANPYARWMCAVKSPYTQGSYDYGDTYVKDIKGQASKVAEDYGDVKKSRTLGATDKQKRKSNPKNWEYWEANDKKYQNMQKKKKQLFSEDDRKGMQHWANDYRQAKKYGNEKLAGQIRQNIHDTAKKIIHKALEN